MKVMTDAQLRQAARWLQNLINAGWCIETVAPSGSPASQILEAAEAAEKLHDD